MDAIKIEILGSGCKKCQQLEANAREALVKLNLTMAVPQFDDFPSAAMGVMQSGQVQLLTSPAVTQKRSPHSSQVNATYIKNYQTQTNRW